MGAGKEVHTYVSFSSQNNCIDLILIYKSNATIEFLKGKVVQRSSFRH